MAREYHCHESRKQTTAISRPINKSINQKKHANCMAQARAQTYDVAFCDTLLNTATYNTYGQTKLPKKSV